MPQLTDALFSLQPGQVSGLVRTKLGFHIIEAEDRRPGPGARDPQVREQIINKLRPGKLEQRLKEITDRSAVQVAEDFNPLSGMTTQQQPAPHSAAPAANR